VHFDCPECVYLSNTFPPGPFQATPTHPTSQPSQQQTTALWIQ
jgi:hypothetical protein